MAVFNAAQAPGVEQVLFKLSANMNTTADQPFAPVGATTGRYVITQIRARNASVSLTTAAGGVYTAASKGGSAIVAAAQAYSALSSGALGLDLTVAAAGLGELSVTPILSLTTAQGAAATLDLLVIGVRVG